MTNPTLTTEALAVLAAMNDRLKAVHAKLDAVSAIADDPTAVRAAVYAANELVGEVQDAVANLTTAVDFAANDPFEAAGTDPHAVHFPIGSLEEDPIIAEVVGPLPEEEEALQLALKGMSPTASVEMFIPKVTRAIPCHTLPEPPPLPHTRLQLELPLYGGRTYHENIVGAQAN